MTLSKQVSHCTARPPRDASHLPALAQVRAGGKKSVPKDVVRVEGLPHYPSMGEAGGLARACLH